MAIGWQEGAAMAIGWLGQAIWPTEGTEDGGRNLELEPKGLTLSKSTGPGRSKARAQPRVGASARASALPEAEGWEGSKEARSEREGI